MPSSHKRIRCEWVKSNSLEQQYHDQEWAVPVFDDRMLFEFLILESAQAGLSWSTILNKRQGYQTAFDHFDVKKIAKYSDKKIAKLLGNEQIVRNKLKINATVTNAKCFIAVQKEYGSFSDYIWSYVDHTPIQNKWKSLKAIPSSTEMSETISKDLKKKGFKFIGSTIIYAFMQAIGMVNDHTTDCFRYSQIKKLSR